MRAAGRGVAIERGCLKGFEEYELVAKVLTIEV